MKLIAILLGAISLCGCVDQDWQAGAGRVLDAMQTPQGTAALSQSDILAGIKEALAKGTTTAINQLGRTDGFWGDASVRIPLPNSLQKAEKTLRSLGQGNKVDQFEQTMNRAAEQAVPQVADIFGDAIGQMTVADARTILDGSDDAATQYFRRSSGNALYAMIHPIVANATAKVGVTQQYKHMTSSLGPLLQLTGTQATDLDDYVTEKTMNGLFLKIAAEEKQIRENPAARTSEILKKVFGSAK